MEQEQHLVHYLDSSEFKQASANNTRLVEKLKLAVSKKEHYEAHQILRTIYFRFINVEAKITPLSILLYHSSLYLLQNMETVSGQDLAGLFLESSVKSLELFKHQSDPSTAQNPSLKYHADGQTYYWQVCQRIADLAVRLPKTDIGQVKFESEVAKISPKLINKQLLHEVLAKRYWSTQDYVMSQYHYLQSASLDNAKDIAKMLIDYQLSGANKNEIDLFLAQFIFHLLSAHNPTDSPGKPRPPAAHQKDTPAGSSPLTVVGRTRGQIKEIAEKIFSNYVLQHPNISQSSIPFTSLPLMNFTYFIVFLLDSDNFRESATVFKKLCDLYQPTWSRDPNYKTYLTRIGNLYFGIVDPAKQRSQASFFNNMLASLLDASDDDDDDDGLGAGSASGSTGPAKSAATMSHDDLD